MKRSTKLFINVLVFSANVTLSLFFALLRDFPFVFFSVVFMYLSYQGIYDVMMLLDANEELDEALDDINENQD